MWAPADLFTPTVDAVSLTLKRGVSFFYENPVVLLAMVIGIAASITVATLVSGRGKAGP